MSIRRSSIDRLNEARKSSLPTIGKGKPINSQGNEGDLTFRRVSNTLMLYIKANHSWHGVKVGESFSSLESTIKDIKSKVDVMKQFRLPSTYSVAGDFTLDVSGDITFDADGGQVTIKDDTANHFLFDCDATSLTIYDDTDPADLFSITVGASGASTIATVDDGAAIGHLTLDADGSIVLDAVCDATDTGIIFNNAGTPFGKINVHHSATYITLLENGGAGSDQFNLRVLANGETNIATTDFGGSTAHITIEPDGDLILDPASGITKFYLNGDTDDLCTLTVAADGATTIATNDSDGALGHLTLVPNGDLRLDPSSQKVVISATDKLYLDGGTETYIHEVSADKMELVVGGDEMITLDEANQRITLEADKLAYKLGSDGDEFSVADSAYAGMVLGCRVLGHDAGRVGYSITSSFATLHTDATVRFVAPPSGVVEVYVQAGYLDAAASRFIYFGLSDNSTYNTIGAAHEEVVNMTDETDQQIIQNTWVISGLTPGDTYNYWFGIKSSGGTNTLNYGGTSSGHYSPFIMKVTALPTAVAHFAVYD